MNELQEYLAVLKNGVFIGILGYGNGSYTFVYDENYEGEALVNMPKDTLLQSSRLYPIFENLLPEYDRRDKFLSQMLDSAEILPLLYNIQGDFQFIPYKIFMCQYQEPIKPRPHWEIVKDQVLLKNDYPNLMDAKILIDKAIMQEYSKKEHSSLSGYQHKIDIDIDFEKKIVIEKERDALYLLKPLNKTMTNYFFRNENRQKAYYPFLALNEHLFMSFAKNELKLDVPWSGIIFSEANEEERDFHYVIKR